MTKLFTFSFLFLTLSLFSQPTDGLIAHYPFNGDAVDVSGNGHDGEEFSTTNYLNRFGISGRALFFNGGTSFVQIPDAEDLRLGGSFTVSFWVNVQEFNNQLAHSIFSKRTSISADGYFLHIVGSNHPNFEQGVSNFVVSGGSDPYLSSDFSVEENTWTHILYDYDNNGNARVFFNNTLVNESSNFPTPNSGTNTDLIIGKDNQSSVNDFDFYGGLDDILFYDRVLTEEERNELFLQGSLTGSIVSVSDISCFSENDGEIDLSASGGSLIHRYSIDGGLTFETGSTFYNLSAGDYDCVVKDNAFNTIVNLGTVTISEPDQIIGTISQIGNSFSVSASGGTAPYSYSIDGENFGASQNFDNLPPATYEVTVLDDDDCAQVIGSIDIISSVADVYVSFSIFPNPVENILHISAENLTAVKNIEIIDFEGRVLQKVKFIQSEGIEVNSLPQGIYYLLLKDEKDTLLGRNKFVKTVSK